MTNRFIAGALLMAAASSAWGIDVSFMETTEVSGVEGDGPLTVTLLASRDEIDGPGLCGVDVTLATADSGQTGSATANVDYTPVMQTVTVVLPDMEFSAELPVQIPVLDDSLAEISETFDISIIGVAPNDCADGVNFNVGNPGAIGLRIFDDGDPGTATVAVEQSSLFVNEADGTVSIGLTITPGPNVGAPMFGDIFYSLSDGTAVAGEDYDGVLSGSVTVEPFDLNPTLVVDLLADSLPEGNETFQLTLSGAFLALVDETPVTTSFGAETTVVTITEEAFGVISVADTALSTTEGAPATVTFRRTGSTLGDVSVDYTTIDGTAVEGDDYTGATGTVSWADGDGADKVVLIDTVSDGEAAETFTVSMSNLSGAGTLGSDTTTTVTIEPAEATNVAVISFVDVEVGADEGETATLTLRRSGSTAGAVSVEYISDDGTAVAGEDYTGVSGTVSWADGDSADKTLTIEVLADDDDEEEAEDFLVSLAPGTGDVSLGSNSVATVTIDPGVSRDIAEIVSLTPNQRTTAVWFDDVCPRLEDGAGDLGENQQDLLALCGLVRDADLDDAQVREVLDAINPEELFAASANALRLSGIQHGNLSNRLNALRGGATGVDLVGLNLEIEGQQIAGSALQEMFDNLIGGGASADEGLGRWGMFVSGRIATGDKDETENETGFDFDLYGVTAGIDYRLRPNLIVGLAAGFGAVDTDYQRDGGGMDIDSWNGSGYLTYFHEDSFYFDAMATYGRNDYDSRRRVVFGTGTAGVDRIARGDTDGTQMSVGFGTGWDFSRGALTFGPHMGGYFLEVDVDGFDESGAGGLDLAIGDQTTRSLTANAGAHASYAWLTNWGVLVPNVKVDWVHEFESNSDALAFQFVNDPFARDGDNRSPVMKLTSDRPDTGYLIWSTGLSAQFVHGFSGFVNYQAYAGYRDMSMQEWSVGARWEKAF